MNRPRLIRGIKITWSVCCGIACVLLLVLWVRSYWRVDTLSIERSNLLQIASVSGGVAFTAFTGIGSDAFPGWSYESQEPPKDVYWTTLLGFARGTAPGYSFIAIPHWLLILLFASLATVTWIRWRFTLRTLLVATTLICVLLGLIVYYAR
jgi:hypothetical protein